MAVVDYGLAETWRILKDYHNKPYPTLTYKILRPIYKENTFIHLRIYVTQIFLLWHDGLHIDLIRTQNCYHLAATSRFEAGGSSFAWIKVKISKSMIIRGNAATSAAIHKPG